MKRLFKVGQRKRENQVALSAQLIESLDRVLDEIVMIFFEPLIEYQVSLFAPTDTDLEELLSGAKADYLQWFKEIIARNVGDEPDSSDAAKSVEQKLIAHWGGHWHQKKSLKSISEIRTVFSRNPDEYSQLETLDNSDIVVVIASAIQALVMDIPLRLYSGTEAVNDVIRESMLSILRDLDQMSKYFGLENDLPRLSDATQRLFRKIAQADDYVWLPLIPLVTSPLSGRDLILYARDPHPATRLANSVVRGDGVTLITGYRGVGKSTFINAVLFEHISQAEQLQTDPVPWKTIPIYVSVAKVSGIENVLRLCIRQIYKSLSADEVQPYLQAHEISGIEWAYRRASFKVELLQLDSFAESKKLQLAFGISPGEYISDIPVIGKFGGLFPSFKGESSKERKQQLDHTISLVDYNEDRAEEDIVSLIRMLAMPRPTPDGPRRIKLVFIFDELDKMDEETGQLPLIKQLKNLFLTRHAVFFLVTSKDFYYLWLKDRKNEDSLLSSYFSSIVMVPIFTTDETEKLVHNLLDIPPGENLTDPEKIVVRDLARYLTYRAAGLPREIIRELRLMQEWVPASLQTFITNQTRQIEIIRIYAAIQRALDGLDILPPAQERSLGEQKQKLLGSEAEEIMATPEYLWIHEASQEQIRRGRYVLVEEMLNRGGLEITVEKLRPIYEDNFVKKSDDDIFALVSEDDFMAVVLQLARHLARSVRYEGKGDEYELFRFEDHQYQSPDSNKASTITKVIVADIFYQITGRKVAGEEAQLIPEVQEYTTEQIFRNAKDLLDSDSQFARQRAFGLLSQPQVKGSDFPPDIYSRLVNILLSNAPENYRLRAASYLNGEIFIENTASQPPNFIAQETSREVLETILQFLGDASQNEQNHNRIRAILIALISEERTTPHYPPSEALWGLILSIIVDISTGDDFETIIDRLPKFQTIPDIILQPLIKIAQQADQSPRLLVRLAQRGFGKLPIETLNAVMASLTIEEELLLWEQIISEKDKPLAQQIMSAILVSLPQAANTLPSPIADWLNQENWGLSATSSNTVILRSALDAHPKLAGYLAQQKDIQLNPIIERMIAPPSTKQPRSSTSTAKESSTKTSKSQASSTHPVVIGILIILMGVVYYYVPYDLTASPTSWERVLERFLQILYMWAPIGVLFSGIMVSVFRQDKDRSTAGCFLAATVILAIVGLASFLVSRFVLALPMTLTGQLALFGLQLSMLLVPYLGNALFNWITVRRRVSKAK